MTMANWNFISKLMSTIGTTAFGVGFTGMAIKGMNSNCQCNSIFSGQFGFNPYYTGFSAMDIQNPYAFLNANITPATSVSRTSASGNVRRTQSAPPPRKRHCLN